MGMLDEFKEFAMRGNVLDLAVGVIMGAAFAPIVATLVDNIVMPPVGYLLAGSLPPPLAMGLGFLTPMSFLIALIRNGRDLVDYLALIFGLALAPVFVWFKLPLDILWAGLLGGGGAWLIHRWKRARAA